MSPLDARIAIRIESPFKADISSLLVASQQPETVAAIEGPNAEVIVARIDDRPVGCIALVDQLRYGEVHGLFVDESVRGRGISAALVRAAERAARDIGLRRVTVPTGLDMPLAPDRYAEAGFAKSPDGQLEKTL